MPDQRTCRKCGAVLPIESLHGYCPACLGRFAFDPVGAATLEGGQESRGTVVVEEGEGTIAGVAGDGLPVSRRRFGDYELMEETGRGGMGVVCRARQVSLDRVVALKLLPPAGQSSPEFVKRFRAEASAAAGLQHPNIVAIHEVGVHEGRHYFAMEFVEGQTLARLITGQPLPAKRAARYVSIVAGAIEYAHEHGILHRDLKPSNILIDAQDQPRVTDFGLAKRLDAESELTVTGQVLGSPNYMPPEQARGGKITRRSDVYALGAILYHCVAGRPPFQGVALEDVLRQVMQSEALSPRLLNRGLSADLETICLRCLEKEPARRYATARHLADELDRFLRSEPIQARPVTRVERVWRWCRRKPGLAAALASAAVLLAVVAIGSPVAAYRINAAHQETEETARQLRVHSYASDMNLAQHAVGLNYLGQARQLLDQHRPEEPGGTDLRGWEWRFLWRRSQSDALFTLCRRTNRINALTVSHDGQWLAIGEHNHGGLSVWDWPSRREIATLPAGNAGVRAAFSPTQRLLAFSFRETDASGQVQFGVRFWNGATGKLGVELPLEGFCQGLAFSRDGRTLVTSTGGEEGRIVVWCVPEGTELNGHPAPQETWTIGTPFALTPDLRLAAHGMREGTIRVIELENGEERWSLRADEDQIIALAFSPDGSVLASSSSGEETPSIRLWDALSGVEIGRLEGQRSYAGQLAFWPDGKTLAAAGNDQSIGLWDVSNPTNPPPPRFLSGHGNQVMRFTLLPDRATLVSGDKDGFVLFWDTTRAQTPQESVALPATVRTWRFGPDSRSVVAVDQQGRVARWHGTDFQQMQPLLDLGEDLLEPLISPDGRLLAVSLAKGALQLWDLETRTLQQEVPLPNGRAHPWAFLPRVNKLIIVDADGGTVRELDLTRLQEIHFWRRTLSLDHLFSYRSPGTFSPDGRWSFALGRQDASVPSQRETILRDMKTGEESVLSVGERFVNAAFSPDGGLIAAASDDGYVRLWQMPTFKELATLPGYRGLHSVTFSPDGTRLAIGGSGSEAVTLRDVASQLDVLTLPGRGMAFRTTAFSPDGNVLGSMNRTGRLHLWRAPSWAEIETLEPSGRSVN